MSVIGEQFIVFFLDLVCFRVSAWVPNGCSASQSEGMRFRLMDDRNPPVGVGVNGCLSLCVSAVIDFPLHDNGWPLIINCSP